MLIAAFNYDIDHEIPIGLVTIGKFDGKNPAMACITNGGRVLIHQPYLNQANLSNEDHDNLNSLNKKNAQFKENDFQFLNTNKNVIALECGELDNNKPGVDLLFIGSKTNVLVYDCVQNSDVFDREINDGISCLALCENGQLQDNTEPLVIIGGNCSIIGLNKLGEEQYWNVSGGNVNTLLFFDFDQDGIDELINGSDDFALRVLKGEDCIFEIAEKASILKIVKTSETVFVFHLSNGIFGAYNFKKKLWAQKSKTEITSMCGCNVNLFGDGQSILVIGYHSGLIEVRKDQTGDLIYKTTVEGGSIAKLFYYDYRKSGQMQVVAVTTRGKIYGYTLSKNKIVDLQEDNQSKETSDQLIELGRMKIELQNKIQQMELKKKELEQIGDQLNGMNGFGEQTEIQVASLPSLEDISIQFVTNSKEKYSNMIFTINRQGWIIKSVILTNEQLFPENNGNYAQMLTSSLNVFTISINNPKNQDLYIDIKLIVGKGLDSNNFLTIEAKQILIKKFIMYELIFPNDPRFKIDKNLGANCKIDQCLEKQNFIDWIKKSFQTQQNLEKYIASSQNEFQIVAEDVRDNQIFAIIIKTDERENESTIQICSQKIDLAGDIIQDFIGKFLKIKEMNSKANFPLEMKKLNTDILQRIKESNQLKQHFAVNISESIQNLKVSVVNAEASLMIDDVYNMRKHYAMVQQENGTLVGEFIKRANNHQELVAGLKDLNTMIRNASQLRLGEAMKRIVALSRDSIRQQTFDKIQIIFENGYL